MKKSDVNLSNTKLIKVFFKTKSLIECDLQMTLNCLQGYLSRVLQCAHELNISDEEVSALFGNIEAIYAFNRQVNIPVPSLCLVINITHQLQMPLTYAKLNAIQFHFSEC